MKIKLWETQRREVELEVEFPIYRKHDLSDDNASSVRYMKVVHEVLHERQRFVEYAIYIRRAYGRETEEQVEIEVDRDYRFDGSGVEYNLGLGEYALTPDQFAEAVSHAWRLVREITPP